MRITVRGQLGCVSRNMSKRIMWKENKVRLEQVVFLSGTTQRILLNAPLTLQMFGTSAVEVCQSVFPALEIHGINLEWPLSVFQGLCLRGERQKHAGAEVPRVPMWYSCCSHRHKSPRNLLQSGCRHGPRLCINEPVCCSELSSVNLGDHWRERDFIYSAVNQRRTHCFIWGAPVSL